MCYNDTTFVFIYLGIVPEEIKEHTYFQYNPCWCLSWSKCLYKTYSCDFNTTLVDVYHFINHLRTTSLKFQYNSCWCLSIFRTWSKEKFQEFQYNSCWCLSLSAHQSVSEQIQFQYNSCWCLSPAFKPFLFFIIASFSDKINVPFVFSQPTSYFLFFLSNRLQTTNFWGSAILFKYLWLGNLIFINQPQCSQLKQLSISQRLQCPPQCLQSFPHWIDFPCFLSFTMLLTIKLTMPRTAKPTAIVPI